MGDGFEPSNSERADLQSAAFDRFAIPPFRKEMKIHHEKYLSIFSYANIYLL